MRHIGYSGDVIKVHIVPHVPRWIIIPHRTGGTLPALLSPDKIFPPPEKHKDLCRSASDPSARSSRAERGTDRAAVLLAKESAKKSGRMGALQERES